MPRSHYAISSPLPSKTIRKRRFEFDLTQENVGSTNLTGTFALPATFSLTQVTLCGVHLAYESPGQRINDVKCITFDGSSCLTVPYTPVHSFTNAHGDKPFAVSVWLYTPSLCASVVPIISHNGEWYVSLTAGQEIQVQIGDGAANLVRTSTEVVETETWTNITIAYSGSKVIENVTIYKNGAEVTYVDNSVGSFEGMTNANVETHIATDDGVTTMAPAGFKISDLVIFSRVLSNYEAVYLYNGGTCRAVQNGNPIAVSRYTGDSDQDTLETITDVLNYHHAAVTGTITLDQEAPAAVVNVAAANQIGTLHITIPNVPELSEHNASIASILGQTWSTISTYSIPFVGLPDGGYSTTLQKTLQCTQSN